MFKSKVRQTKLLFMNINNILIVVLVPDSPDCICSTVGLISNTRAHSYNLMYNLV